MTFNPRDSLFKQRKTLLSMHASTWLVGLLLFAAFCWLEFYANKCGCLKTISNFPLTETTGQPVFIDGWIPARRFYSFTIAVAGICLIFAVIIAESVAQRKRLTIQFSLGLLFTLITLIAIGLVICGQN